MRLKLTICALFAGACCFTVSAQSLGSDDIASLRGSFERDNYTVAVQNVLTNNRNISSNALNHQLKGTIDHYFSYRVNVSGITDQKGSGRCWMFTSLNVLRPGVMEKFNTPEFYFSHNYLYFWDMLEKSNLFLENIIATSKLPVDDRRVEWFFKSPVNDGGVWNLYYNLGAKYGVVPQDVMPETEHSNSTWQMSALLNEFLRKEGYALRQASMDGAKEKALRNQKNEAMKGVYRILALCLGEPPTEFTWRFKDKEGNVVEKRFTPLEFYKEITPADFSPENYIMIMNDPTREYYKVYEIENYRNTIEGINWVYLNLPNEAIKQAALASIKNDEAMYASCDVGKQSNLATGIMDPEMYDYNSLFGLDFDMDKKARILTRQSGSTHAMALVGCDTDENDKPLKWQFENSYGAASGNNGYLTFTDSWFDEYLFRIVIHSKYLDEKAIDALKEKPITVPMWDYMF